MGELQIEVKQQSGSISTNFAEVEAELKEILNNYRGIVVTEDTVAESKKDVATLRKIKSSIDDEKKKVKKLWNAPYVEFETKCKQLMALVDEPINEINKQVDEFETKAINEKLHMLNRLYDENVGEFAPYLAFESTLNEKWQNKSFKADDYLYDLSEKVLHVKTDLAAIKSLNSEIEGEVIATYKLEGNNLAAAIQRNTQYLADKAKVHEQIKAEVIAETTVKDEPTPEVTIAVDEEVKTVEEAPVAGTVRIVIGEENLSLVKEFLEFNGILYSIEQGEDEDAS